MSTGIVTTSGTQFTANDAIFRIVGVNCYFLSYCVDDVRAKTLDAIRTTGSNVIRSTAFFTLQDRLEGLDHLIALAEDRGMKLILPVINYWDDLGGMRTFLRRLFPDRELPANEFYRRSEARAAFKDWIGHLLNRVNSYTGAPYRDSPAIMAWELANEPRCPGPGGRELLLDWTREMAAFVKSQDPNHLVALGDEGFFCQRHSGNHLYSGEYGVDFEATLAIPDIDFGTYHFYPAREQMNVPREFGARWIDDHIAAGERHGKPVLLEEYGVKEPDRDDWYRAWLRHVYERGGAGALLWMYGSNEPGVAGNRDEYTIFEASEVPSLAEHARRLATIRIDQAG